MKNREQEVGEISNGLPGSHASRRRLEGWRLLSVSGKVFLPKKEPLTLRRPRLFSGRLEGCPPSESILISPVEEARTDEGRTDA
jgi:hypothetical protein